MFFIFIFDDKKLFRKNKVKLYFQITGSISSYLLLTMPPKKPAANGPSKKNEMKKKEKTIEDKTFGLKNKKGGKAQKFIAQVNS